MSLNVENFGKKINDRIFQIGDSDKFNESTNSSLNKLTGIGAIGSTTAALAKMTGLGLSGTVGIGAGVLGTGAGLMMFKKYIQI